MRGIVLAATFVVGVLLVGCGQQAQQDEETAVVEATVVETVEETVVETVEVTEEKTVTTASCSDFDDQIVAQQFYDFTATEAEKEVLDSDGNGRACDEPRAFEQTTTQDYEIAEQTQEPIADTGYTEVHYTVYTTRRSDLQQIADELRQEGNHDMVVLEATTGPKGDSIGSAYSYATPRVERAFAAKAKGEIDELIQEQCAEWDTELLGPPPEGWNCP